MSLLTLFASKGGVLNGAAMIKKVFIDLDNTIIKDEIEDMNCYKNVLQGLGFDPDDYAKVYEAIDEYEASLTEENPKYVLKDMVDFINHALGKNYPYELATKLNEVIMVEWAKEERVLIPEHIMEYLASKYELYIFTNYFQDVQTRRIENIGYLKYFKKIFGADVYGAKPHKSCFKKALEEACGNTNMSGEEYQEALSEVIYIGDSKRSDIAFAKNIGIRSVLFDETGMNDLVDVDLGDYKYDVIHNWNEITKIL